MNLHEKSPPWEFRFISVFTMAVSLSCLLMSVIGVGFDVGGGVGR